MDIERLTARNKDGIAYLVNVKPDEQEVDSPHKNTLKCILDCFERLAQYEEQAALRQYQKPTDEAVQMAIEDLESGYHRAEMLDDDYIDLPISTETIALAITALRQMGSTNVSTDSTRVTDKCEWCDKDGPETWNYTRSGKYIPENQPPRNYCRACGRKLVKHDG